MHSIPATAHKTVKWRPVDLAKHRQRGSRSLRFRLAFSSRHHYAPVSRRKNVAPTVLVPSGGIHVSCFYQDGEHTLATRKNLNFMQRAARNPFGKGNNHYAQPININTEVLYEQATCHRHLLSISCAAGVCADRFEG